ncbi:hypothetical protein [Streptomyces yanii]|uniref:Uncharacterized protein n=1 Tax=Streptomyces yanii TaxID=78510 RepID=A0ABV5REU3_9ACTN
MRAGIEADATHADMEGACDAMGERWVEAQLVLPDALLYKAAETNGFLWKIYEAVYRIEHGDPEVGESLESAHAQLMEAKRLLFDLREAMRRDLGASRPAEVNAAGESYRASQVVVVAGSAWFTMARYPAAD